MTEQELLDIEAAASAGIAPPPALFLELIAEVRRLRDAFDEANREAGMWQGAAKLAPERSECAERQFDRLRAENDRLLQDLRDYGHHDSGCPRGDIAFHGSLSAGSLQDRGCDEECTCGLASILERHKAG